MNEGSLSQDQLLSYVGCLSIYLSFGWWPTRTYIRSQVRETRGTGSGGAVREGGSRSLEMPVSPSAAAAAALTVRLCRH
ncbi:unnamed protein product [Linum tenue]|uniref:Uncharacterized protein n=1 Tax=Linum tenue TaxID=586396 RepID=A0AAV0HC38_9ROSI|nr:unnamed protein product [Linum tenue]